MCISQCHEPLVVSDWQSLLISRFPSLTDDQMVGSQPDENKYPLSYSWQRSVSGGGGEDGPKPMLRLVFKVTWWAATTAFQS